LVFALGVMAFALATNTQAQGQAGTTLSAEKTAAGFWERRVDWEISKSAYPDMLELSCNGSGEVTYTITVTKGVVSDIYGVQGKICVTNGGDRWTENLKLVDQVEYKTGAGQFQPLEGASQTIIPSEQLAPGETKCYDYKIAFTPVAGASYRNSVKVTITNHSGYLGKEFGPEPKAGFSLPSEPTIIGADTITVVDTNGYRWTFNDSGSVTYKKTFTCPRDAGTWCNEATIVELGKKAKACVTVECEPCPMGQWCSPGFWRQEHHLDFWEPTGYSPDDYYNAVIDGYGPQVPGNPTLWEVLRNPKKYARLGAFNAVADLLSDAHPDVNFTGERTDYCPLGKK
jgi:hypothetical protein